MTQAFLPPPTIESGTLQDHLSQTVSLTGQPAATDPEHKQKYSSLHRSDAPLSLSMSFETMFTLMNIF